LKKEHTGDLPNQDAAAFSTKTRDIFKKIVEEERAKGYEPSDNFKYASLSLSLHSCKFI
jgi:hypothetical protein